MLLTIGQRGANATDLSSLLHKHPDQAQEFPLGFGKAHVFFPEASDKVTEIALLLDINPVELVQADRMYATKGHPLSLYVNDRPYVTSTFLCLALREVFGAAMAGSCEDKPEAVDVIRPLEIGISALPCDGGETLLRRIFEPLAYELTCASALLDPKFPAWGQSPCFNVQLKVNLPLKTLLGHLYVLIPILDIDKDFWVGTNAVDQFLRHGEGWLDTHPEKALIMQRYLGNRKQLYNMSIKQLAETSDPGVEYDAGEARKAEVERPLKLKAQGLEAVHKALKSTGSRTVLDLGCGEGDLLLRLASDPQFTQITGIDVAMKPLQLASQKLNQAGLPAEVIGKMQLFPSSFLYRDNRLNGYDTCVLMEVIAHQEPHRLRTLALSLFGQIKPKHCIITTPNATYNPKFATLAPGELRNPNHHFEWSQEQFQTWAKALGKEFNYTVAFRPIGKEDPDLGPPSQMAIFHQTAPQTNS